MDPRSYAGVGGKIRRRPPPRAAATPYERPPSAAAAHRLAAAAAAAADADAYPGPGGEGGGWVSRLVDPASRLIAGGAARLFSTVFRKRLAPALAPSPPPAQAPPLSKPPGSDAGVNQDLPESALIGSTPVLEKGKSPAGTSEEKALSEVEHLLMRKTFTKVEFDRLTDLLRARTMESDFSAPLDYRGDTNEARARIDGIGGSTSHGIAVDNSLSAAVPVCGASSPSELAKQYMSSRYSREPQSSSLRSRLLLENKAEASNIAYDRKISEGPLELNEFGKGNPGLPVNGYATPGLRGRSAIYRMSRSPFFKGPSSSSDMNVSPFSSSQLRAQSSISGGRQVLKRRGADLENELGSVGPIRRIRQKSNMMSTSRDARANPQGNFLPSRTIGSDLTEGSSPVQDSSTFKRLLSGTGQSSQPVEEHMIDEGGKSLGNNGNDLLPQSNKMADKIFEQLNIIVPSPRAKQAESHHVVGNVNLAVSKQHVWQDKEPNSLSDPSSSQKYQDLDRAPPPLNADLNGSPSNKGKLRKDGPSKVSSYLFQEGKKDIKSDNVAMSDKPPIWGNSVTASGTSGKPGFKMAVFEDLSEFDDDQEAPVASKNSASKTEVKTTEKKFDSKVKERTVQPNILDQKVESSLLKEKVSSPVNEKPIASSSKDVSSFGLFSPTDPEKKATPHVSSDNNIGFGTHAETTVSQLPLTSNEDNKLAGASTSMFGLKQPSTSDLKTSTTAKIEARIGESVTKPTTLDITNLERGNEREKAEDIHKSSDKVLPSVASTLAASTSPSLSNGFSHPSAPKLPNVTLTDKPATPTIATSFAVSSSSFPISSSFPAFPTLSFGSSTSMAGATKSDVANAEAKPTSISSFGTGGTTADAKSIGLDTASKPSSNLSTMPISTFSSSPITSSSTFVSAATFSSSEAPVAPSSDAIASTTAASTTLSTAPGVKSASTAPFSFSSSGNSIFGFSSPAQSAPSMIFGSKLPQSEGTMPQPSQSSSTQFSSLFTTVATGASSTSGPGTVSFGVGTASTGSGTMFTGIGTSSSGPSTVSFGLGASSSGTGTVSFGVGASSSGPVSFQAGASSSGPGTVSFGATTSSPGSLFGNTPFGSGGTFSGSGTGFAFSSPSSSAGSSLTVASTSMFSSNSTASSTPAFSNPFSSSSSPPSVFSFGQSASSGSAFSFGAQSSPAFSSQTPGFPFTPASTSMNSSTPQPAFGMTNANSAFGMGSPGNDQMNVEDSMADDTNQAAPTPAPIFGSSPFGQPGSSSAAPVFGAPAVQPQVFQFGGQPGPVQQNPAFPPAGGSLEFQGGNFSLGSGGGGGDKSSRRVIKVKRTGKKR